MLRGLRESVADSSAWPWRDALPAEWLSKELGWRLAARLGEGAGCGVFCRGADEAAAAIRELSAGGPVLLKAAHACAGRGQRRVMPGEMEDLTRGWLDGIMAEHGGVLVEPWLERVVDFSALYELDGAGDVKFHGMTVMENDEAGRFRGSRVAPKWGSLLEPEQARFLFGEAGANEWFGERIPAALAAQMPGYRGPVGVDAMVHRNAAGSLALRPVVEVNARMTMGRVAHELWKKLGRPPRGRLRILRRREWEQNPSGLALNDPAAAREFVAVWR
jgi:hypothetical protein